MAGIEYRLDWDVLASYFQFREITAPATPDTNDVRQYATDSGGISTMCWKNDAGNVTCLPTGGGTIPTGSGAVGAVAFWTGTSTLGSDVAHLFWDDTNDQLLIGINTGSHFGTDAGLVVDEDAHSAIIGHSAHSNTAIDSGAANFTRSRGTHASQSIVQSGDRLMRLVAQGYDGAVYPDAAAIDGEVDGTPGSGDMPGRLRFLTTPDGSSTLTERMRIGSDGKIFAGDSFTSGHTGTDGILEIDKNATNAILSLAAHQTSAGTLSGLFMHRSRGTHTSPSILSDGDNVGFILAKGYGSDYHDLAYLLFQVDGIPGSNDMPGRILFATTPDGSASAIERFRIGSAGQWGIGGATFGAAGNPFVSGGASAAPVWRAGWIFNADNRLSGGVVQFTPTYDLISSGHAALQYNNLGSVATLTVGKAIDALTITGTLSTTTTSPDQRNLNGLYIEMVDADNGTGDHRVRPILALVQTSATTGLFGHKAAAIQGTAQATGSSDADLAGITGETIAIASTPAGRAFSLLATQGGVANKAVGLYFGDTGNSWYRGIDFTNATGFSNAAMMLATGATSGKIAWSSGGSVGSSVADSVWLGDPSVCAIGTAVGNQILALVTSRTSGGALSHLATQTQPNSTDTGDAAHSANFTLSAVSATNELAVRAFTLSVTNNLTGGGHLQNARCIDLAATANASTVIDTLSYILFNAPTKTGTITTTIGLNALNMSNADFMFAVPGDTTVPSSTFTGRIKIIDAGGTTRYIPYSNS